MRAHVTAVLFAVVRGMMTSEKHNIEETNEIDDTMVSDEDNDYLRYCDSTDKKLSTIVIGLVETHPGTEHVQSRRRLTASEVRYNCDNLCPHQRAFVKEIISLSRLRTCEFVYRNRTIADECLDSALKDSSVEFARHDTCIAPQPRNPNEPWFSAENQWNMFDIDAPEAWDLVQRNGESTGADTVIIAVVDSGVDIDHPDLRDNMWRNEKERTGNGRDDDGNGYVDDIHGANMSSKNGNVGDSDLHGTHCAGIIGARGNNGIGVVGVKWENVKIMAITGAGTPASIMEAVEYAIEMGALISSHSYGYNEFIDDDSGRLVVPGDSQFFGRITSAASENDHLLVFAVANRDAQGNYDMDRRADYPCGSKYITQSTGKDSLLCVTAINKKQNVEGGFSNRGKCDLAAPGIDVLSTLPRRNAYKGQGKKLKHYLSLISKADNKPYGFLGGTSMATPLVAGSAAVLRAYARGKWLSMKKIRQILMDTVTKKNNLRQRMSTGGKLNLLRAMQKVDEMRPKPTTKPPVASTTTKRPDSTSTTTKRPDSTSSTTGVPDSTSSTTGVPDGTSSTTGVPDGDSKEASKSWIVPVIIFAFVILIVIVIVALALRKSSAANAQTAVAIAPVHKEKRRKTALTSGKAATKERGLKIGTPKGSNPKKAVPKGADLKEEVPKEASPRKTELKKAAQKKAGLKERAAGEALPMKTAATEESPKKTVHKEGVSNEASPTKAEQKERSPKKAVRKEGELKGESPRRTELEGAAQKKSRAKQGKNSAYFAQIKAKIAKKRAREDGRE